MGKFDGKIMLELGTNVASVDIVKYAMSEGAYVIVADYLEPEHSEAKRYANESVMISTIDVAALCDFAQKRRVDGVFCGVSEMNILSAKAVADRLGLPFYFTMDQWNLTQNKEHFKKLCLEHGVPVPKAYPVEDIDAIEKDNSIEYPVIVKPVDLGAAIGVHICNSFEELKAGYQDAVQKSNSGRAIVEKYIQGIEMSAYYTFIEGECRPSIVFDKHVSKADMGFTPLPEVYAFPSKVQKRYLQEINDRVVEMFTSIGLKNGVACIQGMADESGIYVFECGMRLGGTALYRFIDYINGNSFLRMMVDYAMLGRIDADITREDPALKGKCGCILSLLNRGGIVGSIEGFEEAARMEGIIDTELRYQVGEEITKRGTLKQSHIRFFIVRDTLDELADTITAIKKRVRVRDEEGRDMLYSDFDVRDLY